MKRRLKFLGLGLAFSLSFAQLAPVAQATIPHAYWQYQETFNTANANNNYDALIPVSLEIQTLMEAQADSESTRGILYNTYEALARSYEAKADYDTAITYLHKQVEYAKLLGFDDAVLIAEKRILQINPMTEVYALTQNVNQSIYYGAKHEPVSGAYFGRCLSTTPVMAHESAVSFYVECLEEELEGFDYLIRPYDDGTRLIQICLNMPQEGDSLRQVMDTTSNAYLQRCVDYLATLKSPVLLRIGGEMNVFTIPTTPDEYKAAYIKIAQMVHTSAPNVALVFSPNSISSWGMSFMDYYPGDQYVDWVGLSAYTALYRNIYDVDGTEAFTDMFYGTGDYSDPIQNLKEIVTMFGDRKPIIITESGSAFSHNTVTNYNSILQTFSENQLTKLYSYANMVFPQIKAIISFDAVVDGQYTYAMSVNSGLMSRYMDATSNNASLIGSVQNQNNKTYVKAEEYQDNLSTLTLNSFSAPPGADVTVSYTLNGEIHPSSWTLPFQCDINVGALSAGTHSVQVNFSATNGYSAVKYYSLTKDSSGMVTLQETASAVTPEAPAPDVTPDPTPETTSPTVPNLGTKTASPSTAKVMVNGTVVNFGAYEIEGFNYFKLTDMAYAIDGTACQFQVTWDPEKFAINMVTGEPHIHLGSEMQGNSGKNEVAEQFLSTVYKNGEAIDVYVYTINGSSYFQLDSLRGALGIDVGWDGTTSTITITA